MAAGATLLLDEPTASPDLAHQVATMRAARTEAAAAFVASLLTEVYGTPIAVETNRAGVLRIAPEVHAPARQQSLPGIRGSA